MTESFDLEMAVLRFLVTEDEYNKGMSEGDFLVRFMARYGKILDVVAGDVQFPRNIVLSHLSLMEQRGYINFGSGAYDNGKLVGPVKPAGYDFLASHSGK